MHGRAMPRGARLALLVLLFGGCARERRPVSSTWSTMGTFAAVSVPRSRRDLLDLCEGEARAVFNRVNQTLSVYLPQSELSVVNRTAASGPVEVSSGTGEAIAAALRYAELSDGHFDPTVAPLVRFWGFNDGTAPVKLPEPETVRQACEAVGYRRVRLSAPDGAPPAGPWRVAFERPGMSLDLGGVAKGLAVDICLDRLAAAGIEDAMVNLGGNIRCRGQARRDRPWRIGVRNPFRTEELLGVLELPPGWAVATSGNYERYVDIEGQRFTHIIDPRGGYPVKGMAGVTVISRTAVEADAMSTAFFVMGAAKARDVLRRSPGCGALFVADEQPPVLRVTAGFKRCFTPEPRWACAVLVLPE